jgi:hypothetical protein
MTSTKLIFTHQPKDWGGAIDDIWFSGIYKIRLYKEYSDNKHKPAYIPYYKPQGWTMWGNYVDPDKKFFNTLRQAQRACQRHSEQPNRPQGHGGCMTTDITQAREITRNLLVALMALVDEHGNTVSYCKTDPIAKQARSAIAAARNASQEK